MGSSGSGDSHKNEGFLKSIWHTLTNPGEHTGGDSSKSSSGDKSSSDKDKSTTDKKGEDDSKKK